MRVLYSESLADRTLFVWPGFASFDYDVSVTLDEPRPQHEHVSVRTVIRAKNPESFSDLSRAF